MSWNLSPFHDKCNLIKAASVSTPNWLDIPFHMHWCFFVFFLTQQTFRFNKRVQIATLSSPIVYKIFGDCSYFMYSFFGTWTILLKRLEINYTDWEWSEIKRIPIKGTNVSKKKGTWSKKNLSCLIIYCQTSCSL